MAPLITPNVQWGDFYSTWSGSSCPVLWTLRSVLFEHSLPRSMDFHPMSSELTVQQQTHGPSVQISGVFSLRNSFSAILTVVSSCLCFPELRSASSTHWNGPFPLILPLLLILPCGLGNSRKDFQGFRAQFIFLCSRWSQLLTVFSPVSERAVSCVLSVFSYVYSSGGGSGTVPDAPPWLTQKSKVWVLASNVHELRLWSCHFPAVSPWAYSSASLNLCFLIY